MCSFEWPATCIVASGAGGHGWAPPNSDSLYDCDGGDGGVCVHLCVRTRVHVCMHACVRDVFGIYDKNI